MNWPPSPTPGQQFQTDDGRWWEYDGYGWNPIEGPGGALTDPTIQKGDLIVRPAAHPTALTRLPVGANDLVLTADSTAVPGMAWKAAGGAAYVHNGTGTSWVIAHNLNRQYVSVQVVDGSGNIQIPDVDFFSANRVDLTFANPVAGTAIVRR